MHKRGEDESPGRVEAEAGLQVASETCCGAWFGDFGIDKKTGGCTGCGRAEDVLIFATRDRDKIRNEFVRGFGYKVREGRLRWFGRV